MLRGMASAVPVIAVPDRLQALVKSLDGRRVRQPGVPVRAKRWVAAVGDHRGVLAGLPGELDRRHGRAFAAGCPESPPGALGAFVASQIWGYGSTGYGPFRLGQALAHPGLPAILHQSRTLLASGDPVGAFRVLCVANEVPWVGAAFGSKFLYFIDPHGRAVILDRVVRGWLAQHAGVCPRGGRDEREYAVWLLVAEQWAAALKIAVDELELIIFTDALDDNSPWKPQTTALAVTSGDSGAVDGAVRDAPVTQRPRRVVLLGCVKQKLDHRAPAQDLYVSALWSGRRTHAQASGYPWLILSAKHGLLDPEQSIDPYDVALRALDARQRGRWGDRVIAALLDRSGALDEITFEIHAGDAYRQAITPALTALGATVEAPLAGLTMGRQLSWYRAHRPTGPPPPHRLADGPRPRLELRDALHALDTAPTLIAARDWPAGLTGLNQPGLYTWWADEIGASMLGAGLGCGCERGGSMPGRPARPNGRRAPPAS